MRTTAQGPLLRALAVFGVATSCGSGKAVPPVDAGTGDLPVAPDALSPDGPMVGGGGSLDGGGNGGGGGGGGGPAVHRVTVTADGTFTPAMVTIHDGDTVEWSLHDRRDTIVPTTGAGGCAAAAFDARAANGFVGPLPVSPSGIFVISPVGGSRVGAATWANSGVTGVFVRLLWSELQVAAGDGDASYDFALLDEALDAAVASGKLVSLGVKAGNDGTPDWIFSTDGDGTPRPGGGGGVARLALQDGGGDATGCGPRMWLGSPTDPGFQQLYFAMLRRLAAHVRSRADWFRAVAYVKPSGANLFSHENRLPKRCDAGCVCNSQVFAAAGFTPGKLRAFYRAQYDLLRAEFPGKPLSFALIQDGWPSVNENGDYELTDGSSSGGPLPGGVQITQALLDAGQADHGTWFVVQHNGLGPHPTPESCSNYDQHPGVPPFRGDGPCPNRWVLGEGAEGQVTGFQTSNADKVASPADLETTLQNLAHNSDAVFLEIYEERAREAHQAGVLDPASSGRTLAEWGAELDARRTTAFPGTGLPDPFPSTFRHTFTRAAPAGAETQTLTYMNGTRCPGNPAAVGSVVIVP